MKKDRKMFGDSVDEHWARKEPRLRAALAGEQPVLVVDVLAVSLVGVHQAMMKEAAETKAAVMRRRARLARKLRRLGRQATP